MVKFPRELREKLGFMLENIKSETLSSRYLISKLDLLALIQTHQDSTIDLEILVKVLERELGMDAFTYLDKILEEYRAIKERVINICTSLNTIYQFSEEESYIFEDKFCKYFLKGKEHCFFSGSQYVCTELGLRFKIEIDDLLRRVDFYIKTLEGEYKYSLPSFIDEPIETVMKRINKCITKLCLEN